MNESKVAIVNQLNNKLGPSKTIVYSEILAYITEAQAAQIQETPNIYTAMRVPATNNHTLQSNKDTAQNVLGIISFPE